MAKREVGIPAEQLREGARLYEEGTLLVSRSDYRAAIDSFHRAMRVTFPDALIWNEIAYCYLMLKDNENCRSALNSGLDADPENTDCMHNLALLLRDEEEFAEAEDLLTKATELQPSQSRNWRTLGSVLFEQGEYVRALKAFATGSGLAPNEPKAHYNMALVLERLKENERAESEFIRAVELAPRGAGIHADYGRFLARRKRFTDAGTFLRKAVEYDPTNFWYLTDLAAVMIQQIEDQGENPDDSLIDEVLRVLSKTTKLEPGYGKTWFLWGAIEYKLKRYRDSEAYIRTALDCGYDDPWAYVILSAALVELGRKQEADEMFEAYRRRTEGEQ